MLKTRSFRIVLAIVLIAACIWYLSPSYTGQGVLISDSVTGSLSDSDQVLESSGSSPLPNKNDLIRAPVEKTKSDSFPKSLSECFPDLVDKVDGPKSFIENWKIQHPGRPPEMDSIHYFFKDENNKEMRAQILYNNINGRIVREFKLFKVLEDGLPDPVTLDESDIYNPSDSVLNKHIHFAGVFETQKKWSSSKGPKDHIEVEESNDQITEFQLFQESLTFRCHESECECKR